MGGAQTGWVNSVFKRWRRPLFMASLIVGSFGTAACASDDAPTDASIDTDGIDGSMQDAAMIDGALPDVPFDGGSAEGCQAAAQAAGYRYCQGDGTQCAVVFEDGVGCPALCRTLGLVCRESYDDVLDMCDYRRDLPALNCAETGHGSDYCVCGVATAWDAGVADGGMTDSSMADGGTDAGVDTGVLVDGGAIDAGDLAPHELLLTERVGFGATTTGGLGGPIVEVTSLADSGPGTLRAAATLDGPKWIRFRVSGVINLSSGISITSDTTIDGRGADITITGGTLLIQNGTNNVILNDLKLRDAPDDLIRFYNGGERMWVHHCDLSRGGDGAFDATEGVTEVTVSYCHLFDHDKAMLVGASSDDGDGSSMRWTGHHNWYDNCVQRLPFIRMGWAHSFNNLIEWRSGTAMSVRLGGQMLVENNILAPQTNVGHKVVTEGDSRGAVRFEGNLERPLSGDVIEFTEYMRDTVFNAHDYYPYVADPADAALDSRIRAEAGWRNIPFPE